MKKHLLLLLGLAISSTVLSAPVSLTRAHRVAVSFWNSNKPESVRPVSKMQLLNVEDLKHQYIFSVADQGFVIISADDQVTPVIGYSFDSHASDTLNPEVRYWLQWYDAQIAAWDGLGKNAHPKWAQLESGDASPIPATTSSVTPLCKTRWGQGYPFNTMCPWDSVENARAVVGCVATAMSQIMKYWNHPSCGTKNHEYQHTFMGYMDYNYGTQSADFEHTTYMWENMPNYLNPSLPVSTSTENALSILSYHCGVSVDMMYGTESMGGSGAYSSCGGWATECAENAFHKYFKYSSDNKYVQRCYSSWNGEGFDNNFIVDDSTWMKMVDDELAAGRPLYYDGSDYSGGHAFVLDGAKSDSTYHFNWGWYGSYDGYYLLSNIAPGAGGTGGNATYTFNFDQGAIIGIIPIPEVFDTITIVDSICKSSTPYEIYDYSLKSKTTDTILRHLDTIILLHLIATNSNSVVFDGNNGNFEDKIETEYCRYDGILMPQCTFEKANKVFAGWSLKKSGAAELYQPGDVIQSTGNVTVYARWQDSSALSIEYYDNPQLETWPNPIHDILNVQCDNIQNANMYIIDPLGRRMIERKLEGNSTEIDVSSLRSGLYILQVRSDGFICNRRIIKL